MTRNSRLDPFLVDEQPVPVPPGLADLAMDEAVSGLIVRCARLESIIERERSQATDSMRTLLLALLDVADALDRVASPAQSKPNRGAGDDGSDAGVDATNRLLKARLAVVGVVPMDLVGKTANPATADIAETEADADLPDEIVVRQITTGYWWGTTVLRRASVVVTNSQPK